MGYWCMQYISSYAHISPFFVFGCGLFVVYVIHIF